MDTQADLKKQFLFLTKNTINNIERILTITPDKTDSQKAHRLHLMKAHAVLMKMAGEV